MRKKLDSLFIINFENSSNVKINEFLCIWGEKNVCSYKKIRNKIKIFSFINCRKRKIIENELVIKKNKEK